ncbi:YccJ family protein [Providencia rettgeri]
MVEQIWKEGVDKLLPLAFSKTTADRLYWGKKRLKGKMHNGFWVFWDL